MHKKDMAAVFLAVLMVVAFSSPAQAMLYSSWGGSPNISDPNSDAGGGAKDITGIWYAKDATNNYFRMDLNGAISAADHAGLYGIYITSTVPSPDTIPSTAGLVAMIAFDFNSNLYTAASYTPSGTAIPVSIPFQKSDDGKTLEWSVPLTSLDGFFYYMGATITGAVNDTTTATATPIPSTVWLLGTGVIGLIGLKRRQSRSGKPVSRG